MRALGNEHGLARRKRSANPSLARASPVLIDLATNSAPDFCRQGRQAALLLPRCTLKGLEKDGLVNRTMYPTIPPRVDYELTDLGRKLIVPLQSLYDWAVEHRPAMLAAREKFAKKQRKAALRQTSFTAAK